MREYSTFFCCSVLLVYLVFNAKLEANSFTETKQYIQPKDPNYVIAKWEVETRVEKPIERVEQLLAQAKYPGNSDYYAQASLILSQIDSEYSQNLKYLYATAVVKQYYHQFEEAKVILERLLELDPQHVNARLLLSNMHLVMGQFTQARKYCISLTGIAESILVAACTLNAEVQAEAAKARQNFAKLLAFNNKFRSEDQETNLFIAEILASMAVYANDYKSAEKILSQFIEQELPVSFWVLWSDVQLALGKPANVLAQLGDKVSATANQDDALILRLGLAEKSLLIGHQKWVPKVEQRMALRELRQDQEHAYDLAVYYLHLMSQAQTALKWAEINLQQAKLIEDARLLQDAKIALNNYASEIQKLYNEEPSI